MVIVVVMVVVVVAGVVVFYRGTSIVCVLDNGNALVGSVAPTVVAVAACSLVCCTGVQGEVGVACPAFLLTQ